MGFESIPDGGEDRKINRVTDNRGLENILCLRDNFSAKIKQDKKAKEKYEQGNVDLISSSGIALSISAKKNLVERKKSKSKNIHQSLRNIEEVGTEVIGKKLLEQLGIEQNQEAYSLLEQTLTIDEQKWLLDGLTNQDDEDIGVFGNSIKNAFLSEKGKELSKLREENAGNYFRYKYKEFKLFLDWKNGAIDNTISSMNNRELAILNAILEVLSKSKGSLTEEFISREANVILGRDFTKSEIDKVFKKFSVLSRKDLVVEFYGKKLKEVSGRLSETGIKNQEVLDEETKNNDAVIGLALIAIQYCDNEQLQKKLDVICNKPADEISQDEYKELLAFVRKYNEHLTAEEGIDQEAIAEFQNLIKLYNIEISEEYNNITFRTTDEVIEDFYGIWEIQEIYWESISVESQGPSNTAEAVMEGKSLTKGETIFIQRQNTPSLDEQFSQLFEISGNQSGEDMERMQRILSILPEEQYEKIFEKLEHNQVLLQGFEESTGIPKSYIPQLLENILNGDYPEDQLKNGRERLRTALRKVYGGEIQEIVNNIQGTLKQQAGECVLNLKTNYLEESLGFSIFQTQADINKENTEEGVFYFRDKNHPDTQYCYNALTGTIAAEQLYTQDGGIIHFGGGKPILIKQIAGYKDLIGKLDVASIVLENGRSSDMEGLTSIMRNNMIPQLYFSDGTEEIARIREKNENARVKNEIIGNIGKIFGLEGVINSGEDITESRYGPYYSILNITLNTINNPNGNLEELNRFISNILKIKEAVGNKKTIEGGLLKNPIAKYINEKSKYDNELQYQQEQGSDDWGSRKAKDLAIASILTCLIKEKGDVINLELVMNLNNAGEENTVMSNFIERADLKYQEYSEGIKNMREKELNDILDSMYST